MRIGILTFQRALNYGAVIQSMALQNVLKKMGHDVEIIDYRCPYLEKRQYNRNSSTIISGLKSNVRQVVMYRDYAIKKRRFEDFRNDYLTLTDTCDANTIEHIAKRFDAIIVGSDQVWNFGLTGNDTVYLLDFKYSGIKISYAASIGTDVVSAKYIDSLAELLSDFDCISVRERTTRELLQSRMREKDIKCVLDPTLLLNRNDYLELSSNEKLPKRPYIFVYALGEQNTLSIVANDLASRYKMDIVCLCFGVHGIKGAKNLRNLGPIDVIDYIRGASYVLTSSFHGMCFSIIFRKDFGYVLSSKNNRNARLIDLASALGFEDRVVSNCRMMLDEHIDYSIIDDKLDSYRNHSIEYLNRALK